MIRRLFIHRKEAEPAKEVQIRTWGQEMIRSRRALFAWVMVISTALVAWFGVPYASKVLTSYSIPYWTYNPPQPVRVETDTSALPDPESVPILMYHGVINSYDSANTTISNFVLQMEMLKRNGFETIRVADFDAFRNGKFKLPKKPIIITFDDGRKDSYYTTDNVLEKLGFKATMFVSTGRTDVDNFFLSWTDLQKMKSSGRWELQAHGKFSHDLVAVNADGSQQGRYLTSKMYLPSQNRLETDEEFRTRVENDYLANIRDLKQKLGIDAKYIAIPLNDYGITPETNYPDARAFNMDMTKKYFKMAFIQANGNNDVLDIRPPVYNFADSDPYQLRRIEVKNMSAEDLKNILETYAPSPPALDIPAKGDFKSVLEAQEGAVAYGNDGSMRLTANVPGSIAQVSFGQFYWSDYAISTKIRKETGRSIVVIGYMKDSDNYVSCGITDNSMFLRERIGGTDADIANPIMLSAEVVSTPVKNFVLSFSNNTASCSLDNTPVFKNIPIKSNKGMVGVRVWGTQGKASGIISQFSVLPVSK